MRTSFPIGSWIFGCFSFSFILLRTLGIQEGKNERRARAHPEACVRAKRKIPSGKCE